MKIRQQQELENEYREIGGMEKFQSERDSLILEYPFSVLVTADYIEIENAEKWCSDNVSEWTKLWYGKIDYDYGYIEFFFKTQEDKERFQDVAEKLVVAYSSGIQGRTVDTVDITESNDIGESK